MAEKEYIEREEVLKIISRYDSSSDYHNGVVDVIGNIIHKLPAADVVPVKHGRWVKEKPDVLIHWHCSVCEKCYFLEEPNADYCPHCGAKMDGGDLNGS